MLFTYLLFISLVLGDSSTSLGCGVGDTGEPQAMAHVEFDDDTYQEGSLDLLIDWGDGHGFRQVYNLSDIHGVRLDFSHVYENITDPDDWSFPLVLHADVTVPNETEPLLTRQSMICGMSKIDPDSGVRLIHNAWYTIITFLLASWAIGSIFSI